MILKDIKIFSQNVWKNSLMINTILEVKSDFDIIFIQEPSWSTVCSIPSSMNCKEDSLVGVVNHPNWLTFTRKSKSMNDFSRVAIYINIRLSSLHFSLYRDIINFKDILLVSFFNNNDIFWLMNVYFDLSHSALKYLKDTEVNICNLLIMTSDFNICDNLWDSSYPYHSLISNDLLIIADSFNLDLSFPTNHVPSRYLDNKNNSNLVIDLMFLHSGSNKLDCHSIHLEWHLSSDHTPLMITIPIIKEHVNSSKCSIGKDSEEEVSFIKDVSMIFRNLNMSNISDLTSLDKIINDLAQEIEYTWEKHSKIVKITKYSKSWWDGKCSHDLEIYRITRSLEDWKTFQRIVKITKRTFFDLKIQEIVNKKQGSWELMN